MISFIYALQDSIQSSPILSWINNYLGSDHADILSTLNFVAFKYYLTEINQVR